MFWRGNYYFEVIRSRRDRFRLRNKNTVRFKYYYQFVWFCAIGRKCISVWTYVNFFFLALFMCVLLHMCFFVSDNAFCFGALRVWKIGEIIDYHFLWRLIISKMDKFIVTRYEEIFLNYFCKIFFSLKNCTVLRAYRYIVPENNFAIFKCVFYENNFSFVYASHARTICAQCNLHPKMIAPRNNYVI